MKLNIPWINSRKRFLLASICDGLINIIFYSFLYSIQFNSFTHGGDMKIIQNLKNITKIKILRLILPSNENITKDFKTIVSNSKMEPYLIVNIDEFDNQENITNVNFNYVTCSRDSI